MMREVTKFALAFYLCVDFPAALSTDQFIPGKKIIF